MVLWIELSSTGADGSLAAVDLQNGSQLAQKVFDVALRYPENAAVQTADSTRSFRELAAASHAGATWLAERDLGTRDIVALRGKCSFGFVAASIAALARGCVILYLDPALPPERQRLVLDRSSCSVLLDFAPPGSDQGRSDIAPSGLSIVRVDPLGAIQADARPTPVPRRHHALPEDAGYIVFTSGSTGSPKAVLGSKSGLDHFVSWQRETFGITATDRCAQVTSVMFDVVLREIFTPLTSGATLCIPPRNKGPHSRQLLEWLADEAITLIHVVPGLAERWLASPPAVPCETLRYSFFAGEPLTATLVRRWRAVFPLTTVVNLYGPTETTLAKTSYVVPAELPDGPVPVGEPLPGTEILILHPDRAVECALGDIGEVAIRTSFASFGYLDDPEETRRRLIPSANEAGPTTITYRTGDRGRLTALKCLELQGRIDRQLKIRGVRIEPEEIERTLHSIDGVSSCAVVAQSRPGRDARLVAYVTSAGGQLIDSMSIRRELARRLPAPLVPEVIEIFPELPLTTTGKIDREALRALNSPDPSATAHQVFPRDALELELSRIWAGALGVEIGVTDDLFRSGGDSLTLVSILTAVEDRFGEELPIGPLMAEPTIERMAMELRGDAPASRIVWPTVVTLKADGARPPLFCMHVATGTAFCYADLAHAMSPGQPVYGIQAPVSDETFGPHGRSIESMAQHYVSAIRGVAPDGPFMLAGYSYGGKVAIEVAQQLVAQGHDVRVVALFEAPKPAEQEPPADEARDIALFARSFANDVATKQVVLDPDDLRGMSPRDRVLRVLNELRTIEVVPPRTDSSYINLLIKSGLANRRAARGYTLRPYPGRLTYFATMEAEGRSEFDWTDVAIGGVDRHLVPGDHLTMLKYPHVQVLAAKLEAAIADALGPASPPAADRQAG